MRQRKPTNLHLTLERYHAPIVDDPAAYQGRWRQEFLPNAREVRLDLGCGKGTFIAAAAAAEPDVLFVGLDFSDTCIARAAQKVVEGELPNVRLICADAALISQFFAPQELTRIYLNFNSPFPKRKYAQRRLSHLDHLLRYRTLVGEEGLVEFRTDNLLYAEFSLVQMEIAGYTILRRTDDLHACAEDLGVIVASEYDQRTTARGAKVLWLQAHPGPERDSYQQTDKLGLVDYIPEDVEHFDAVPYGMEDTFANMRNRRANAARKSAAQRQQ